MSTTFAWPICNRSAGDYAVVTGTVCLGRPFRQPLNLPDAANFSDGLELWLKASSDSRKLNACFNGTISFTSAAGNQPAKLSLSPDPVTTTNFLRRLNFYEPQAKEYVYFNVDRSTVRTALITLITDAFTKATGAKKTWHPILLLTRKDWKKPFKDQIAAKVEADRAAFIGTVVDTFLSSPIVQLSVLAGDIIGEAATAFGGAVPPANCPFAADNPPPRQFVFKILERCDQVRDPLYDLWSYINKSADTNPVIKLLAPSNSGTANLHPIIQVTGLSTAVPKPTARKETTFLSQRPIPMLGLNTMHSYDTSHSTSRVQWRLTDDGLLEAALRAGADGTFNNSTYFTPNTYNSLVTMMWTTYGKDITDMSNAFQVPCELIMAFLGKETGNLDKRIVRFEPVNEANRQKTDKSLLTNANYVRLSHLYTTVIPASGFAATVPPLDPPYVWQPDAIIRTVGNDSLTWGKMAELLDLSDYYQSRLSPGLAQTLISTAQGTLKWIAKIFPDIQNSFPLNQQSQNWWDYFGIDPLPSQSSGYLKDWLITPRHSIFVGTAYIRKLYNDDKQGTCWDPPKAAGAYNAGSVREPSLKGLAPATTDTPAQAADKVATSLMRRLWGVRYYGEYVQRFGSVYNAAVNYLNTPPSPLISVPTVRLRR